MKTLDIFHSWFIIYAIVTKTMITLLKTFDFCFTENKMTQFLRGAFSPNIPYIFYSYQLLCEYLYLAHWVDFIIIIIINNDN